MSRGRHCTEKAEGAAAENNEGAEETGVSRWQKHMIKKLRKRFIWTACLAVLLVLIIMMGSINLFNYRSVVRDADRILAMLAENDGEMPGPGSSQPRRDFPDGDRRGDFFRKRELFSEETRFESRYFTVTADESGSILSVSTANVAAVSEAEARAFAEEVLGGSKEKGFLDDYRYLKTETEEGSIVIFLDCTRSLANAYSFLLSSLGVSLAAFVLVAGILAAVSGRILRPVAESYQKQKGFITDAGHELKTPVAVIEADAAVLEMEIGENEWVDDIKKQTKRLADLTGELTYLARMDEGSAEKVMIAFPISDVVEETASSFQARALVAGKTFETHIEPMLELTGDEAQIRKLTSILLDNAVKYSPEGGRIGLDLRRKGKNIVLSVRNTADHVDEDMLAHMFDRFYRGDRSRSAEGGGFGIGLSIARSIAEAHHGKISAAAAGEKEIAVTVQL